MNEQQAKIVLSGYVALSKCQKKKIEGKSYIIYHYRSSNKMPQQVAYAFKQVFMEHGGLDAEQAENYWSIMTKTGQYQEECWS